MQMRENLENKIEQMYIVCFTNTYAFQYRYTYIKLRIYVFEK